MSPNLALHELAAARRAAGDPLVHMAFGEARLPLLPGFRRRLVDGAERAGYGPVAGSPAVRREVAGWFARRRVPTDSDQIVVGPGTKPLLMAIQLATAGDVVLPRPAWNSYGPQVGYAGKRAVRVDIPEESGGVPSPDGLRAAIADARSAGRRVGAVVVTIPDNPTGTFAPPALVRELCEVAEAEDLLVVSDEIYRDTVHDGRSDTLLSPAEVAPTRTVVTTGLSKSLAVGGWRIGAARFPAGPEGEELRDRVVAIASDVWTALAGPMDAVAEYAFSEPAEVRRRLAASVRLHGAVATAVHDIVTSAGAACRTPTAAFYVYPDFEALREPLADRGATDSASLAEVLLDAGLLVLAGHHLGDHRGALRCKMATSLLYGEDDDELHAALDAPDPTALPHIRDSLDRIEEGLARLTGRVGARV
jgi:aspartate aminotransferase